jgi:predicted Zn finger-like uncharacterized protein
MIIECPSCASRFHLADGRVPARGARVRCSRCQHRFFVTRSGDVEEAGERTAGGDANTTPALERGPLPGELTTPDARVDQSNPSLPRKLLSDAANQHTAPTEPTSIPRPRARPAAAEQDAPEPQASSARAARDEDESPPPSRPASQDDSGSRRKPASLPSKPAKGRAGKDDPDLENPEFLFDENEPVEPAQPAPRAAAAQPAAAAAAPAAAPSASYREFIDFGDSDEEAAPTAPVQPAPAPAPSAKESADDSQSDALAASLRSARRSIGKRDRAPERPASQGTQEDSSWGDPGAPSAPADPPARAPAPRAEPNRASEPAADPEPKRRGTEILGRRRGSKASKSKDDQTYAAISAESQGGVGTAAPATGVAGETSTSRLFERVSRAAVIGFGLLLAASGVRALIGNDVRATTGPAQVQANDWEIRDVEVLRLRDSGGQRVMVVRGRVGSGEASALPGVQAILLDAQGQSIGTPIRARLPWLELSALAPERIAGFLSEGAGSGPSAEGFTILIPAPPEGVRRFRLEVDPRS